MSRGDSAFLIAVVIALFILLPPTGGFFLLFLKRLSIAGIAALAGLIVFLLIRSLKE